MMYLFCNKPTQVHTAAYRQGLASNTHRKMKLNKGNYLLFAYVRTKICVRLHFVMSKDSFFLRRHIRNKMVAQKTAARLRHSSGALCIHYSQESLFLSPL